MYQPKQANRQILFTRKAALKGHHCDVLIHMFGPDLMITSSYGVTTDSGQLYRQLYCITSIKPLDVFQTQQSRELDSGDNNFAVQSGRSPWFWVD